MCGEDHPAATQIFSRGTPLKRAWEEATPQWRSVTRVPSTYQRRPGNGGETPAPNRTAHTSEQCLQKISLLHVYLCLHREQCVTDPPGIWAQDHRALLHEHKDTIALYHTSINTPSGGPYCISLVVWFFCLLHYTTQATISSVKHKELFHRNYLEKYVPGTFFPQTYCCLHSHRSLSTEKIRQIVMLCNVRSAHVSQYQVHKFQTCILGSSHELDSGVWIPPKSDNSANSSVLDNISQLALATAIFLTVFTDEI